MEAADSYRPARPPLVWVLGLDPDIRRLVAINLRKRDCHLLEAALVEKPLAMERLLAVVREALERE